MKIAPLPALVATSVLQLLLGVALTSFALKASVVHQKAAELYTGQVRLRKEVSSAPTESAGKTVPLSVLRFQTEVTAAADRSLTACLYLAVSVVAVGVIQLWLATDARRERRERHDPEHIQNS